MSWQQIKNIIILKCQLLSLYATMNHFSIRLWHVTKSGLYMTTSYNLLSGWTKKKFQSTSQSQIRTKKRSWSLFDLLQLPESQQNHYIWEVCSANLWDASKTATPAASIGQQKGPNSSPNCTWHKPMLQQLNELGYEVLPHPPYSPDLLTTDYHFFTHLKNLLQRKHFQTRRRQKMLSRVHRIPKHGCLCYGSKLISHWPKYVDCNGPYFD